jgi:hypothetical protein
MKHLCNKLAIDISAEGKYTRFVPLQNVKVLRNLIPVRLHE